MNSIILGLLVTVGVSLFTEFVSWVSKKVSGTPLDGQGAVLSAVVVSILGGIVYVAYQQIPGNYIAELSKYSLVFLGGATLVFNWIIKNIPAVHTTPTPTTTG